MRIGLGLAITDKQKAGAPAEPPAPTYHLNFDGVDDKIVIPAVASLNNLPLGDFTVEWSGQFPRDEYVLIIGKLDGDGFTRGWAATNWSYGGSKNLQFAVIGDGGNGWIEHSYTLLDDNIHHYEFSWKASTKDIRLFVDGVEFTKVSDFILPITSYLDDSAYDVAIGGYIEYDGYNINGSFNWLRVANIIRHTSNFTPPSLTACPPDDANTVLRLALDEGTGSAVGDTSGNGNNGVITGAAWQVDS